MLNADTILQAGGLLAVAATIFAETGLLLGFFLPGDTLLLTGGLFAGEGKVSIIWLNAAVIVSAVLGYQVGYIIGERTGPRLFKRKDGLLFREEYIQRTQNFFKKYGPATLIIARVIANVRTLIPLIAGAGKMNRGVYFIYNVIGAVIWSVALTMLGYWLGSSVPNIDKFFFPLLIAGLILLYSLAIWGLIKSPERRRVIKQGLKEEWKYYFKKSR
ncbi:MAG TPA: DedA family protein [Candidatus Saccharimonadales bacterium]|nr:DedA family protein [Candidatus Saccharimonadales bacterium]